MSKVIKYKNGFTLVYKRQRHIDGVYARLKFDAGAINEDKGKNGLAHLTEHCMVNLSNKFYSRDELTKLKRKFNMVNAVTSTRMMDFIGKFKADQFEDFLDIKTSGFAGFKDAEKDFEDEKKVVLQEIAIQYKINFHQNSFLNYHEIRKEKAYNNLTRGLVAGDAEMVKKLTLQDVEKFAGDFLVLNNAIFYVVGNISLKRVKKGIEKYIFARVKESGKIGFSYEQSEAIKQGKFVHEEPYEKQKDLLEIFWVFDASEKYIGHKEVFMRRLIRKVLNDMAFKKFRVENSSCYHCAFLIDNDYKDRLVRFIVECGEDRIVDNFNIFMEFVEKLKNEGLDKETFELQKQRYMEENLDLININNQISKLAWDFENYGVLLSDRTIKKLKKEFEKIPFEEYNEFLKKTLHGNPNVIVLSSNEKAERFDRKKLKSVLK